MSSAFYPYHFVKQKERSDVFDYFIQFSFEVPTIDRQASVTYVNNIFRYKSYLYITDFFPKRWDGDVDRVNKLLSVEENIAVNFRKITLTCFYIFHSEIISKHEEAGFAVSGSFVHGEKPLPGQNISRKLKLYLEILQPVAIGLDYRIVPLFECNAFIIVKKNNVKSDQQIVNDFTEFKKLPQLKS